MASLNPFNGTLDLKKAAHLLRRTSFGPTRQQIDRFVGMTVDQALAEIYQAQAVPATPSWLVTTGTEIKENDLVEKFRYWFLDRLKIGGTNGTSGIEKLVFFLHTHFTTQVRVVESHAALYYQNVLLRYYALGNIKQLAKKISIDNAMLILLDGRLNAKGNPNENYARELLELYTIAPGTQVGPGDYTNYTEADIKAAAKVLSGWQEDKNFTTLDPLTGIPQGKVDVSRHDATPKTFSKAFQNKSIAPNAMSGGNATPAAALDEVDQLVEMIFAQQATAKNLCRKIYRFFMYYKITDEVENDVITPMANTLIANNYELKPVLFQLLKSLHFYDEDTISIKEDNNRSAIIKSPLEVSLGTMRFFNIDVADFSTTTILTLLYEQGMDFYQPLDVAGYDAYHQEPDFNRNWISTNNLARRYEFGALVLKDGIGFKLDILKYVKDPKNISNPFSDVTLVTELIKYMLPEDLSTERFQFFLDVFTEQLPSSNWTGEWNKYINGGSEEGVRRQLEKLVNSLLQSAEYQLF